MRVEYTIVRAENLTTLARRVDENCKANWVPTGGITIYQEPTWSPPKAAEFLQPMVRTISSC